MNVHVLACELMRLTAKNRHLHPQDMKPKDLLDSQALIRQLRRTPTPYPHF